MIQYIIRLGKQGQTQFPEVHSQLFCQQTDGNVSE